MSTPSPSTAPAPIVALTAGGPHAWIMIHALRTRFGDFPILLEEPEPAKQFWQRRRRLLGPLTVASMQAARLPIALSKRSSDKIIAKMVVTQGLNPHPVTDPSVIHVPSVNSPQARDALVRLQPKAVFVVSTRMIGTATRTSVDAPFLNYHSGINPAYRGMFGGYFALANGEPQHFGATVHLIDGGVDTGEILYQSRVKPEPGDTFHTHIWRIAAGSREIVVQAMEDALANRLRLQRSDLPSRQYFAPTLGFYLKTGLLKGVW